MVRTKRGPKKEKNFSHGQIYGPPISAYAGGSENTREKKVKGGSTSLGMRQVTRSGKGRKKGKFTKGLICNTELQ